MLVAFAAPLWRIELRAPQYPEGLGLRIWVDEVRGAAPGDLRSINGLNHYIGMKAIEPDTIPELRLMPWVLASLVLAGVGVAAIGRRRLLAAWIVATILVAAAGLVDFWRWGYLYGHTLDPKAIIRVDGMSYQPPLIGSKQLLNFEATSWPGLGGWAIVGGLVLAAVAWKDAAK